MFDLILGIVAAVMAATLYSLGFSLQAMDAREAPQDEQLRPALALRLLKRVRWLSGTGLSVLGWPLQVLALSLAPLVVVQPALALGLPVLMVLGERMLGERAGRREHLAVGAIVLGVIGAGLCAPPRSTTHADWTTLALVLAGLALASMLPYLLLRLGRSLPAVTMLGAGLAFGWSGVATKLASDDLAHAYLGAAIGWGLATAGASAIATLSEMSSLQSRPAIQVAPVVFVIQTVVPVALAPLLFGESFSATPAGGVPLGASLALVIAGAAVLARSPLLLALMPSEPGGEPALQRSSEASDSAPSRSEPSHATSRSSPSTEAGEPSTLTTRTSPARIRR
jgi:drug/metabolite transporter (DMT)-like permease